ncbi:hypothetical protein V6N13_064724 [Hibiscus sabdariffa]|uniref:RNase H type-1 domain-containing protein n=1 Tax=Hibiscus sabdariffa TaxID=183260 RepID=A0ABR2EAY0_9ROSI
MQLLHEGLRQSIHRNRISAFILAHIPELDTVVDLCFPSLPSITSIWSPPAPGIIKFNFDTSFNSPTKEAFSGIIARNSSGLNMAVCLIHHSGINDAFIAEAKACESVVNSTIELGFRSIHEITFSHVGGRGNEAAHALVKVNHHFQLPRYWIEEASSEVEQVALPDLR